METMMRDALDTLLAEQCDATVVRQVERTGDGDALWQRIWDSGFVDAMLDETQGGAALGLQSAYPLMVLCGRHALPLPLAETMLARIALSASGVPLPEGAITLAQATAGDGVVATQVRDGKVARWVLVDLAGDVRLLPVAAARCQDSDLFPLDAHMVWPQDVWHQAARVPAVTDLLTLQACVVSAKLAGALSMVFDRTLQYANERQQFGRPIGKFQAIQHQLSQMAEQAFVVRMAACLGCQSADWQPDVSQVAVAKACASEAALVVAELAHAIHGAIGFTQEFDLQLYTRRLHHWRQTAGSESFWHDRAGTALLDRDGDHCLDMVRQLTDHREAA